MILELHELIDQGGFILFAIMVLSVCLYGTIASIWFSIKKIQISLKELHAERRSTQLSFQEISSLDLDLLYWVKRRLPLIGVLMVVAPLAGLLGTVSGMLKAFSGLASSTAVHAIDTISIGISKAMITTQAELIVAIPASFLFALLIKKTHRLENSLEHQLIRLDKKNVTSQTPSP